MEPPAGPVVFGLGGRNCSRLFPISSERHQFPWRKTRPPARTSKDVERACRWSRSEHEGFDWHATPRPTLRLEPRTGRIFHPGIWVQMCSDWFGTTHKTELGLRNPRLAKIVNSRRRWGNKGLSGKASDFSGDVLVQDIRRSVFQEIKPRTDWKLLSNRYAGDGHNLRAKRCG